MIEIYLNIILINSDYANHVNSFAIELRIILIAYKKSNVLLYLCNINQTKINNYGDN